MNRYILNTAYILSLSSALTLLPGCEREIDTSVPATSPKVAEVFIDGFASGVDYQAWGKPTNLSQEAQRKLREFEQACKGQGSSRFGRGSAA